MKHNILKTINYVLYTLILFFISNAVVLQTILHLHPLIWVLFIILYILIQIFPLFFPLQPETGRLKNSANGCGLLVMFLSSTVLSVGFFLFGCFGKLPAETPAAAPGLWIVSSLLAIVLEAVTFWNGIIRVYLTSEQLGIRIRILGIAVGMIPIAHLIALGIIIRTVAKEVAFENEKIQLNKSRAAAEICATKYPILMVHGVFFRDFRYLNYWGRIPKELETNGAVIFYGNHQSAAPMTESGKEIAARILQIVSETGCEKVNIIGHSKGGLDARAALQLPGIAEHVASLTTVNTPHRGCEFADYLLTKIPVRKQNAITKAYNTALHKLGDPAPDFLGAVNNLTASFCREFNDKTPDAPGVYYQSIGSGLNRACNGRFPLNFTYHLVNYFDGANDGLVGERSFPWGAKYQFLTVTGKRGISHGDMIDLNRENIPQFDVREFFVQLVADLKKRGL